MSYTANQFLSILKRAEASLTTEDVNCPELSEDGKSDFPVHLKELTGSLMDIWNRCFEEMIEDPSLQAKYGSPSQLVIALSVVDQAGDRVFKPHDFKGHAAIGGMPNHVKDRLAVEAYRISKMRKVDQEEVSGN